MKKFSDYLKADPNAKPDKSWVNEHIHYTKTRRTVTKSPTLIGNHCAVSGEKYRSLKVTALPHVVEFIKTNMIPVEYDQIYFEVVIRADGGATLYAKSNQILASRSIADIDPESIPE